MICTVATVTQNQIRILPVGLKDLTLLKKLIMTDNKLQKIPQCVMLSAHLREVDLSLNEILSFPEDVSVLTRCRGAFNCTLIARNRSLAVLVCSCARVLVRSCARVRV